MLYNGKYLPSFAMPASKALELILSIYNTRPAPKTILSFDKCCTGNL